MGRLGLIDTTPEARRVLDGVYRAMPADRKIRLQVSDYRLERSLHETGMRSRQPGATADDVRRSWNLIRLGPGPWDHPTGEAVVDRPVDNFDVVREVTAAFDRLEIAYALGGSWASSFYGEPRSTRDADVTVEPFPGREAALVAAFGPDYYVSLDAVKKAVRERRTFNIINTIAGFKVDAFVRDDGGFHRSLMARRAPITAPADPWHPLVMVSPEDTVLLKLEWYRLGGESSERQWLDILGVLRVQAGRLDAAYLDRWAADLGVADLLAEARRDAAA